MTSTLLPEPLISAEAIDRRITELATAVQADYADWRPLVLLGVLKGAFVFLADLTRRLRVPHRIDFVALASYQGASTVPAEPRLRLEPSGPIAGQHVLVVEDIVDTAQTWSCLRRHLTRQAPASLRLCSLLSKPARHQEPVVIDYLGFEVPDVWVVGYGLDCDEQYRSLPYIGVLDPSRKPARGSGSTAA